MGADVMDYDELNTGKRREGSFSACSSWTQKVGLSIGAFAAGYILPMVGFDAKLGGAQRPETIVGIKIALAAIPLVGVALALMLVWRFPLTPERVREIRTQLEARRGKV